MANDTKIKKLLTLLERIENINKKNGIFEIPKDEELYQDLHLPLLTKSDANKLHIKIINQNEDFITYKGTTPPNEILKYRVLKQLELELKQ